MFKSQLKQEILDDAQENTFDLCLKNLTHPKANIRADAIIKGLFPYIITLVLARCADEEIKQLANCLNDKSDYVRQAAVLALLELTPRMLQFPQGFLQNYVILPLANCLKDEDALIRAHAIKALSPLKILLLAADSKSWGIKIIKQLASCLTDTDFFVRRAAIDDILPFINQLLAADKSCGTEVILKVFSCLGDKHESIRRFIINVFQPSAKKPLLPLIAELLEGDKSLIIKVMEPLKTCLTDADVNIRIDAIRILSRLTISLLTVDRELGINIMQKLVGHIKNELECNDKVFERRAIVELLGIIEQLLSNGFDLASITEIFAGNSNIIKSAIIQYQLFCEKRIHCSGMLTYHEITPVELVSLLKPQKAAELKLSPQKSNDRENKIISVLLLCGFSKIKKSSQVYNSLMNFLNGVNKDVRQLIQKKIADSTSSVQISHSPAFFANAAEGTEDANEHHEYEEVLPDAFTKQASANNK